MLNRQGETKEQVLMALFKGYEKAHGAPPAQHIQNLWRSQPIQRLMLLRGEYEK